MELLQHIILSRALYTVAELNIAEHLSSGKKTIETLAQLTSSHSPSLSRLLDFLVISGFFQQEDHYYSNNDRSLPLMANHPTSLKPYLLHDDPTRWNSFGHLTYSIQTGKAAFDTLYGQSYFQYLTAHPQLQQRFDDAMLIISAKEDAIITQQLQFIGIIADIGGGKGQLLDHIRQQPTVEQTILFDLPEVIQQVQHTEHILVAGSFFTPIQLQADIYILKRILHDWDDEQALRILQHVAHTMPPNSRLYVIDGLLDKATNRQFLYAVDLALLTIFQGKERTLQAIIKLAQQANLHYQGYTQLTDYQFAIEFKRAL